ncbi:MAG: YdeI/OmpD-associated family protein [Nanoarchaeota archaeon]
MTDTKEFYYAKNREAWRAWLQKHQETKKRIYLIRYKKHTGQPTLSSREAMEEAICFGWIDTIVKRLDHEKFTQCFVSRTEKSRWSNNTLSYARRLIKEKRMTPRGLKFYTLGLRKPVIDHGLPRNPDLPKDLEHALNKDKKAKEHFLHFAPSYRRVYIYWIERAKRAETRQKRIKEVVKRAHDNKKWGM